MTNDDPIIRAFELARSGECGTWEELKARLRREGYELVDAHLSGKLIKQQLRTLMNLPEQRGSPLLRAQRRASGS